MAIRERNPYSFSPFFQLINSESSRRAILTRCCAAVARRRAPSAAEEIIGSRQRPALGIRNRREIFSPPDGFKNSDRSCHHVVAERGTQHHGES
jgi:hypothetical protein